MFIKSYQTTYILYLITSRDQKSSNINGGGGGAAAAASSSGGGNGGGGDSCSDSPSDDNEGTSAANVSFADTIDAADPDLETRGARRLTEISIITPTRLTNGQTLCTRMHWLLWIEIND